MIYGLYLFALVQTAGSESLISLSPAAVIMGVGGLLSAGFAAGQYVALASIRSRLNDHARRISTMEERAIHIYDHGEK